MRKALRKRAVRPMQTGGACFAVQHRLFAGQSNWTSPWGGEEVSVMAAAQCGR